MTHYSTPLDEKRLRKESTLAARNTINSKRKGALSLGAIARQCARASVSDAKREASDSTSVCDGCARVLALVLDDDDDESL